MSFDAALEQLRRAHQQSTKDLEETTRVQADEIAALKQQLAKARAEAEDYKNKYITTKTNLKRYAEKFETWLESIKKAKQEKKRDSSSSVVIDVESDSFDLAPVSPLPPAEKKSATNGKDVAGKREKATRESTSSSTDQRAAKRKFSTTPSKTTLRGELAAEFPADTPPDEPALLTRSITTTSSASTCGPTPPVPTQTQTPTQPAPFKYVEVVRKRAERDMLPAAECEQCKQFLDALTDGTKALDRRALVNMCSRHRARFERPPTPPGFWDLSFPQGASAERLDDQ